MYSFILQKIKNYKHVRVCKIRRLFNIFLRRVIFKMHNFTDSLTQEK